MMRPWTPWLGIKQTPDSLVKPARAWSLYCSAILLVVTSSLALSATLTTARADDDRLPEIDAKTFNVQVMRKSRSGNVYVLETSDEQPLHSGKILLLRKENSPVMALRVLRDYSDKNQFAAKWVRRYHGIEALDAQATYLAIEKIADREGPPLTAQDRAELKEVESDIPPPVEQAAPPAKKYDSELDASTSPPPTAKNNAEVTSPELTSADVREIDELKDITAEELVILDREKNWLGFGYEIFRQNGAGTNSYAGYFGGFDLKYGRTIKQLIYLKRKDIQDSFTIEGSLGYYKVLNFVGTQTNDSYTVIPFTLTGRYNVNFGEDITVFAYVGINKNILLASSQGGADGPDFSTAQSELNSVLPAVGIGMLFRIGPGWYIRFDGGLDQIGLGMTLRY